ncbi:MAG TPA: DegT/DnrJ/EryC1/StrS family aminotransferase, partial [bacterium]|nr:DegT/DnrJ/EryC1/StrS family aminotransferase [bacterium]
EAEAVMAPLLEAHGARWRGRMAGTAGVLACYSFYANKLITTGEGGMVLTDDRQLRDRLRLLRNAGLTEPRFQHEVLATNYRLTNLQAAIGCAQLAMIDTWLAARIANAAHYTRRFTGCAAIATPVTRPHAVNAFWMYGIELTAACPHDRATVITRLDAAGIETRPFFHPLHRQPVFARGGSPLHPACCGAFPVSDRLGARGLYLPSGSTLTAPERDRVADAVLSAVHD